MSVLRFTLPPLATLRSTATLATELCALPGDDDLELDASGLTHCDTAALQLLVALRQGRVGRTRVTAVPDDHAWRFRCVGIDPLC